MVHYSKTMWSPIYFMLKRLTSDKEALRCTPAAVLYEQELIQLDNTMNYLHTLRLQ